MNILMVGAGAVGQVYGRHLALGGARVTFLIRPKYRADLKDGMRLYPLNAGGQNTKPVHFTDFRLMTTDEDLESESWDQVWLCVSSSALRKGWLASLLKRVGKATVVALQTGLKDRSLFLAHIPKERLVNGLITLISYPTPLPEEPASDRGSGMAYWVAPLSSQPFSGHKAQRDQVIRALNLGGMKAKMHPDVAKLSAFPAAILMSLMMSLEGAGWSFSAFASGSRLSEAVVVVKEALVIAAHHYQCPPPWWRRLISPGLIRLALALAPRIIPLPVEPYLQFHFSKVGDQTRLYIDTYLEKGRSLGLPTEAMAGMSAEVFSIP